MTLRKCTAPVERFWRHVAVDDVSGCWLWTGARYRGGYAAMGVGRADEGIIRAHRFSYARFVGDVPQGKELDHLCRVRHCVNPAHLEPVTRKENFLRGDHWAAKVYLTDVCRRGHSMLDAYRYKDRRQCRICTLRHYDPVVRRNRYERTGK